MGRTIVTQYKYKQAAMEDSNAELKIAEEPLWFNDHAAPLCTHADPYTDDQLSTQKFTHQDTHTDIFPSYFSWGDPEGFMTREHEIGLSVPDHGWGDSNDSWSKLPLPPLASSTDTAVTWQSGDIFDSLSPSTSNSLTDGNGSNLDACSTTAPKPSPNQSDPQPSYAFAKMTSGHVESAASTTCSNCSTHTTSLWRRDSEGLPICNACGLFIKLHGIARPLSLKTSVVKKRKRGSCVSSSSAGVKTRTTRNMVRSTTRSDSGASPHLLGQCQNSHADPTQ
jgi:hypothetical protein